MVAKLPMPEYDSLEVVSTVISERKRFLAFYRSITDDLRAQILSYLEVGGDPSVITPLNLRDYTDSDDEAESRKKSLINLYSPKPDQAPYEILEDMRNEHGLLFCPSCGEDGAPGTLDHYLPKTEFPELAVCVANLTPMCSKCQGKKSSEYQTPDGQKAYLHPYYDEVLVSLFHVDIALPFSKPSAFTVAVKDSITGDFRRLVESHIQGVEFKIRFEKYCESKHMHLLKVISKGRRDDDPIPARHVIRVFLRQEQEKALNAWGAIYYQSVLDSPELLDYLDNGILPRFI
ncbi:hypothetical protein BA893_00360 [Vibrio natriegens]|uniref:hypothetical protein n=1 Tax=Vibrio harveyi group TaxID=717610 RepID=UPI0008046CBB|nr:hypothetical protein [Vibrio natriegens]ANQ20204.1 hypothetical protein BA893_00360 [Vibrio natriegens]MBE4082618.1 hypothetical protein [Vibrio parahaemolyticus]